MSIWLGQLTLIAAVLMAAGGLGAALRAARFGSPDALRLARWAMGGVAVTLTLGCVVLVVAFVQDDFHYDYVASFSEKSLPLGYKLAAFWAGQEGSLLLWAWLVALFSGAAAWAWRRDEGIGQPVSLATLLLVCAFFCGLILFAANPFQQSRFAPLDGRGLNPQLQDPAMMAHPPTLFAGYAGFTIPFALLIGALASGRLDGQFLARVRRWTLGAWLLLGIGIVLGSWWAYVELGWGGYWAWDPVENASLLPWLTATALLHSIIVQRHRGLFKRCNAQLITANFLLCFVATYLTRSGVVQSVHAFGESLVSQFFLFALAGGVILAAALMAYGRQALRPERPFGRLVSREGAFLAINVLLVAMAATTLVGTLLPALSQWVIGRSIAVGAGFYNQVVVPLGLVLAGLMVFAPVLAFGRGGLAAGRSLAAALIGAIHGIVLVLSVANRADWRNLAWALVCGAVVGAGLFLMLAELARAAWARRRRTGENPLLALGRLIDGNHGRYGGQIAHLGMLMIVAAVAGSGLFVVKETLELSIGQSARVGNYALTVGRPVHGREANYEFIAAPIHVTTGTAAANTLRPESRIYDKWAEMRVAEVDIRYGLREDFYLILAGWDFRVHPGTVVIQAFVNPLVSWLWIGSLVLSLGGLLALLPRFGRRPVPAAEADNPPRW